MEVGKLLAGRGEGPEVGGVGNAGQFAFEVVGEFVAVTGMVEQAVNVVEDGPLIDFLVAVVSAKFVQRPVSDVLAAVGAEILSAISRMVTN